LSVHRNNPIIQSWGVKAGSNLLSGTATLAVEKVFLAAVTPASPRDNDIALVKLQSPLRVSGETWHTPPWSKGPERVGGPMPLVATLSGHRAEVWRGPRVSGASLTAQQGARLACGPGQGHLPCEPPQTPPVPHLSLPDSSKPICLPYFDEELVPGTSLWVVGWGYTQEHGERDSAGPALCLSALRGCPRVRAETPSTTSRSRQGWGAPCSPGTAGDPSEQLRFAQASCRRPCSRRR